MLTSGLYPVGSFLLADRASGGGQGLPQLRLEGEIVWPSKGRPPLAVPRCGFKVASLTVDKHFSCPGLSAQPQLRLRVVLETLTADPKTFHITVVLGELLISFPQICEALL